MPQQTLTPPELYIDGMEQQYNQQQMTPLQRIFAEGFNERASGHIVDREKANTRAGRLYPVWGLQRMRFMAGWDMANAQANR